MTFTSGDFGAQTSSHLLQNLSDYGREFHLPKTSAEGQREFYMAQSVLARIRTGAEKQPGAGLGRRVTQEFNGQEKKAMAPSASAAGRIGSI
jgi:hypothetical protein